MNFLAQSISAYLTQIPVILVWLAGIVIAIYNRRRYPQAAVLTLIAVLLFLFTSLAGTAFNTWLPFALHARGMAASRMGLIAGIISIVRAILNAIAFGLLLAAIFGWRQKSPMENQESDRYASSSE